MVIGGEQLELREGQLAGCQHLGSSLLISKLLRMGGIAVACWRLEPVERSVGVYGSHD